IRDLIVTGVQTCALPISPPAAAKPTEKTSKNEPAMHAEEQAARRTEPAAPAKYVHATEPDRPTAYPELLAQQIREQYERTARARSEERRVGKEGRSRWSG